MTLEERAQRFATRAHEGQLRKYTKTPYIEHPANVVEIVRTVPTHTEEMLAAAWLHDVVEDCHVTFYEILATFGQDVADMVVDLTDVSKRGDGNRAIRKELDRLHTAKASPASKTIKLADLIDNSASITKHDPQFALVYLKEKRALLEVMKDGDPVLWERAARLAGNAAVESPPEREERVGSQGHHVYNLNRKTQ